MICSAAARVDEVGGEADGCALQMGGNTQAARDRSPRTLDQQFVEVLQAGGGIPQIHAITRAGTY